MAHQRSLFLRPLFCLMAAGVQLAACSGGRPPEPVRPITILTGGTGGAYYPLGTALANIYNSKIPGLNASAVATVGSVFNVQAIQAGHADIAFSQGDVAYFAYRRSLELEPRARASSQLLSIAALYVNTVQIVARRSSGIRRVSDFRGRRVGVGGEMGSGTETAARTVIESYGLTYKDVKAEFLSFSDVAKKIEADQLDVAFIVASYPVSAITEINTLVGVRLIPVESAAAHRIRSQFPFFKRVVIPRGTYRGQEDEVDTVGVDNLLICRGTLPEALVYRLTQMFFLSLPDLVKGDAAARLIDVDQAPATPIPLHPGAARFYRERELFR